MTEPLRIDYEAFARELDALRAEVDASLGPDDFAHLRKIEGWGRLCSGLGYGTAWIAPNPVSAWLIGQGSTARWTMMAHHVCHRGYDKVPGVPERYTSKKFATGSRRLVDWFDWIDPEAWIYEHNVLHHYHTGELADPDLVEENVRAIRDSNLPMPLRYAVVGFYSLSWKWSYYAPNTLQVLQRAKKRRAAARNGEVAKAEAANDSGDDPTKNVRTSEKYLSAFDPRTDEGRDFWKRCMLPYGLLRFGAIPAAYAPLGPWAVFSVWSNSVMAEAFNNLHSFLIIASNHAGDDLYRFEGKPSDRAEFYVRQVLGSVNYRTGGDVNDFLHGFLNYQIEHHVFPDLPMRQYQLIQPRVKAICEKHGVPYVQESVFKRARRLVDIMVGKTSMLRGRTLSRTERQIPLAAE
jgi:fatty acid desaturase